MPNNPLSATPERDQKIKEWECPYCEQTRTSLSEIRDHITESAEGDHRGVDGLKPTRNVVAYGADGTELDRMEGVTTEPADPIEQYDKREIIINSWLAADREPDRKAVEAVADSTQQYVSKLLNDIESGEIPRETWVEAIDYGLRDELKERLEQYDPEEDTSEDSSMSAQTATAEEIIEEASKKDRIIAAHRVSPTADKNAVADALDVSYEYVRQIFNDIEDRDPSEWKKLREGDLEEDPDPALRDAVEQRLQKAGAVTTDNERQEAVSRESVSPIQVEGVVSAEDIAGVREKVELLREQAEYTENGDAEFVAQKTIQWLDELLEQSQ